MKERTLSEILSDIQIDLATVKTDVVWLKRLFVGALVLTGTTFGINISGVAI